MRPKFTGIAEFISLMSGPLQRLFSVFPYPFPRCLFALKARILRLLTHPSVVTVEEVFSDSPDYFYLVLEHMTGGPVFDRIVTKVGEASVSSSFV